MSSATRAYSLGPSTKPVSKVETGLKHLLSDSEDTSDREESQDLKQARKPAIFDSVKKDESREKDKKRRRKKRRKLSVVEKLSTAPSGSRSQSVPPSHVNPLIPGPSVTRMSGNNSHARQSSVASSSVTARTHSAEPQPFVVPTSAISTKGKEKACEEPGEMLSASPTPNVQGSELSQQLTAKTELLGHHTNLLSTLQQSLTCQICLELMHRPFALAPCGHAACHTCLLSWFKAPPTDVPPGDVLPPMLRKKTCPHCRAQVRERPIEVWAVKEMVSALVKSDLANPPPFTVGDTTDGANANTDPWEGVFRKTVGDAGVAAGQPLFFPDPPDPGMIHEVLGIHDNEDGGVYRCIDCMHEIWDGVCSSCGREYPGHLSAASDDDIEGMVYMDESIDDGTYGRDRLTGFGMLWDALGLPAFHDDESDDEDYHTGDDDDHRNDSADDSSIRGPIPGSLRGYRRPNPRIDGPEYGSADEDGEGYESSFIDDEEDDSVPAAPGRARLLTWFRGRDGAAENGEGEGVDEHADEHPVLRRSMRRRMRPAITGVSSDEEPEPVVRPRILRHLRANIRHSVHSISSDEEPEPAIHPHILQHLRANVRHSVHSVSHSENESDNDDADLATEVAARERARYGDDGSVARRPYHDDGDGSDARHTWTDEEEYSDGGDRSHDWSGEVDVAGGWGDDDDEEERGDDWGGGEGDYIHGAW